MKDFFHFGKSETIIISLLLIIALIGLFAFKVEPFRHKKSSIYTTTSYLSIPNKGEAKEANVQSQEQPRSMGQKDSIETADNYVGPPQRESSTDYYERKFPQGTIIDLNACDSATLTRIPGIGPAFARRIVSYRNILGGYYTVLQLQEVFKMDYERYQKLKPWFKIGSSPKRINLSRISPDSIPYHPYLNYKQHDRLKYLIKRGDIQKGWKQLLMLPEFTQEDSIRLSPYFMLRDESNDN